MFIKGVKNNFDIWSGWHFFGPYFLCDFISPWLAGLAVLLWEGLDWFWSKNYFMLAKAIRYKDRKIIDSIFDNRGVSWGDLVLGFGAIGIWVFKH